MRTRTIVLCLFVSICFLTLSGCKGAKKVATYEDLYKEKPVTIITAPVQDNAKRPAIKTKQDEVVSQELTDVTYYMRQSFSSPLASQGYYTIAPLAADELLGQFGKSYKQLQLEGLTELHRLYGIDAVLLVAIHKWQEPEVNEVVVYAEYTLRSTQSGLELMHTWVRGSKIQPVDVKGDPVELTSDLDFMQQTGMDSRMAHRCILVEQMSDFVLRNLPTSASRWMYEHDRYINANPAFYSFIIYPDGSVERSTYSEDAFGNECFTD